MKNNSLENKIDMNKLEKKLFKFLNRTGIKIVQRAAWDKFSDSYMSLEDLNGYENFGYQAIIRPKHFYTAYESSPKLFNNLKMQIHNHGIFIQGKRNGKMLISSPPIREITLYYTSKFADERKKNEKRTI